MNKILRYAGGKNKDGIVICVICESNNENDMLIYTLEEYCDNIKNIFFVLLKYCIYLTFNGCYSDSDLTSGSIFGRKKLNNLEKIVCNYLTGEGERVIMMSSG